VSDTFTQIFAPAEAVVGTQVTFAPVPEQPRAERPNQV
jgi:hypothetical protein